MNWTSCACDLLNSIGFISPYELSQTSLSKSRRKSLSRSCKFKYFDYQLDQISKHLEVTSCSKYYSLQAGISEGRGGESSNITLITKLLLFLCFEIPEHLLSEKNSSNNSGDSDSGDSKSERTPELQYIISNVLNIQVEDLFIADNGRFSDSTLGLADCVSLGALVYEKLGMRLESYVTALRGSQACLRATSRCECDLVLARLYAEAYLELDNTSSHNSCFVFLYRLMENEEKRNTPNNSQVIGSVNFIETARTLKDRLLTYSEEYFSVALIEARRSRFPIYELNVAKEYESYLLQHLNRSEEANEIVNSALNRMGRTWDEFAPSFDTSS